MFDPLMLGQKRTKVVDLGSMSREELIEVAKKQARQMREKNIRIQEMEQIIDAIGTEGGGGGGSEGGASPPPRPAAPNNQYNNNNHSVASSNDMMWETSESRDDRSYSSRQPRAATAPNAEDSVTRQNTTVLVSELEHKLKEKESLYNTLYQKTEEWKVKVKSITEKDQERIAYLEQQLQALQSRVPAAPPLEDLFSNTAPAAAAVPPSVTATTTATATTVEVTVPSAPALPGPTAAEMEAEIQKRAEEAAEAKLEVWRGRFYEKLQEQSDTIDRLQNQLLDAQHKLSQVESHKDPSNEVAPATASAAVPAEKDNQELVALQQQVTDKTAEVEALQCKVTQLQEQLASHHATTTTQEEAPQLQAEIARLQTALAAAEETRAKEAAKVAEWQTKVKERFGEKESELATLHAEVRRLEEAASAAAAAHAAEVAATAGVSPHPKDEVQELHRLQHEVARLEEALRCATDKQITTTTTTGEKAQQAEVEAIALRAEVARLTAALAAAEDSHAKALEEIRGRYEGMLAGLRASVATLQQNCAAVTEEKEELEQSTRALMHFKEMTLRSVRE